MQLSFRRWPAATNANARDKILFLHGMGGTGSLWRPLAATLENEFEILAVDQRGHGGSQISASMAGRTPPRYTPLDYANDVAETLRAQRFFPTWVVGHSMGVRTACALAHIAPELVRGLCLVDLGFSGVAGGGLGESLASFISKLPHHFASREEARAFMERECPDASIAQYLMAVSVRDAESGVVSFPFDHAALVATIHAARDVSVREWVRARARAGMPMWILRGDRSSVWSHEEFESERREFSEFPSLQFFEMPGTGHGLPFEKRREFCEGLVQWIRAES
jgi:pimeloyl-ACP methyl ester carboxylesterase